MPYGANERNHIVNLDGVEMRKLMFVPAAAAFALLFSFFSVHLVVI